MSNRLGGKQGTAYIGTNANQPPNWTFSNRDPDQNDWQNVSLGDLWHNKTNEYVWVLVSLEGNSSSAGPLATWVRWGNGNNGIVTLTGNAGGAVAGDGAANVNVIGDGTTISVTGNPGTNTLTIGVIGGATPISNLQDDFGTDVPPTAGILKTLGTTDQIITTGNIGASSVTWSLSPKVPNTFNTDGGGSTNASLNTLTITGSGPIATTVVGPGNVGITFTPGSSVIARLEADDTNQVPPTAGVIETLGTTDQIITTGNIGASRVTWSLSPKVPNSFPTDSGTAVPALNSLTINGTSNQITTSGAGSTVTIALSTNFYQTGTWTPSLTFGGLSTGITYARREAQWTLIGNVVFIAIRMELTSKGSATGIARVTGLPFTVNPSVSFNDGILNSSTLNQDPGYPLVWSNFDKGTTTIKFVEGSVTGASVIDMSDTNFFDTSAWTMMGNYFIS